MGLVEVTLRTENERLMLRMRKLEEENRKLQTALDMTIAKADRLGVQLDACSAAALGTRERLRPADYGWSPAYADVMSLRERMEAIEEENRKLRATVDKAQELINGCKPLDCEPADGNRKCLYECRWFALEQAIAALDGGEKGGQP